MGPDPSGVDAFARRGNQIATKWHDAFGRFPNFDTIFDPVSGVENLPQSEAAFIMEGRLLRDVLYASLPKFDNCACPELTDQEQIPLHLFGLFVLLQTTDLSAARELSSRPEKALQLLGMVMRQWINGNDQEAQLYLEEEFASSAMSAASLRSARVLVSILRWISSKSDGHASDAFLTVLAKVAVGALPASGIEAEEEDELYWLRWHAAEAIMLADQPTTGASQFIIEHLERFRSSVAAASTSKQLEGLSNEYESGEILRVLVDALGSDQAAESGSALRGLLDLGEDKLRAFPFLYEDIVRSLDPSK